MCEEGSLVLPSLAKSAPLVGSAVQRDLDKEKDWRLHNP
jgi:hypothetical protein